jgi:hypothetical protein
MTKFFAGVLSVIALGVMLIAYGLLSPQATASTNAPFGPMPNVMGPNAYGAYAPYGAAYAAYPGAPMAPAAGYVYADRLMQPQPYGYTQQVPYAYTTAGYAQPVQPVQIVREVQPVRTVTTQSAPRRTTVVERAPRRDWKKTAMVIGGSTATGAGVGGIFAGKKGALIGAAIGGGASSIYEASKN